MNKRMQAFGISTMLSNHRAGENFDFHAHIDSRLTYGENRKNVQRLTGITTRNRGYEQFNQENIERAARQKVLASRRENPYYQDRQYQTPLGIQMDMMRRALPPGRRVAASGKVYYERRSNRSDQPNRTL
jgi:hypothetical protein